MATINLLEETSFKKQRKSNFSPEEIDVLVSNVLHYYDILYGQDSKKFANKDTRQQAWLDVLNQVNQVSLENRTLTEVKNKWKKCQHLYKAPEIIDVDATDDDLARNVWEPQTILDSMPLQQRITKQQSSSSESQEPVLQSQPLSPTKLKVTRQAKTPTATPKAAPAPIPEPPNEEVCLRWNSHHANMQTAFPSLLLKEQYVDTTLVADGKTLKCHRMILSSCSTYFEEVLSGISPFQHPVIFMKDIPFWILKSLCDFMYAGEVHIYQNKLEELLSVAEVLKIKGLAGKTDTNEDVKPIIQPKKEEERPKEVKEEKKKEEKKKHQPATPAPKEEPPPKAATPKPSTPKPSTSKASHSVRKPDKAKEKEKTPIKKDENLMDPLDLLEPMYEEEVTKEPPKSSIPVKTQEKKSIAVKKPVGKKVKKRKNEEREESPPPFMQQRKGTRSRPNVKIPKYYHYDRIPKDAQVATIVREPHTTSVSDDSLMQVEVQEIKDEPIDVEDDVIEIEDNVVSFSDQDLTSQDGEEIIGNYDSPIVNIKKEKVAKESLPAFKPISLVAQPFILNVHTVSEGTSGSTTKIDPDTPKLPVVSDILISNIQSLKESEVIDVDESDLKKSKEINQPAFKIECVVSESTETPGEQSKKTVKLETTEKTSENPIKIEDKTAKDSKSEEQPVQSSEDNERLEINTMDELINTDSIEISDDDLTNKDAKSERSKGTTISDVTTDISEEAAQKKPLEETEAGFKGFKDMEMQLLQSDDDAVTSQNVEDSSLLNLDENVEGNALESSHRMDVDDTEDNSMAVKEALKNIEVTPKEYLENMDADVGSENLKETSKDNVENVENLEYLGSGSSQLIESPAEVSTAEILEKMPKEDLQTIQNLNNADAGVKNVGDTPKEDVAEDLIADAENVEDTPKEDFPETETLNDGDKDMEKLPNVEESPKDLNKIGELKDKYVHEGENLEYVGETPKEDLVTYDSNADIGRLQNTEEKTDNTTNEGLETNAEADSDGKFVQDFEKGDSNVENLQDTEENSLKDDFEVTDELDDNVEKPSVSSETPPESPEKTLEMIVNDLNESLKTGDDIQDSFIPDECGKSVEEQIDDLWEQMSDNGEQNINEQERRSSEAILGDSSIEMSNVLQDVNKEFEESEAIRTTNEESDLNRDSSIEMQVLNQEFIETEGIRTANEETDVNREAIIGDSSIEMSNVLQDLNQESIETEEIRTTNEETDVNQEFYKRTHEETDANQDLQPSSDETDANQDVGNTINEETKANQELEKNINEETDYSQTDMWPEGHSKDSREEFDELPAEDTIPTIGEETGEQLLNPKERLMDDICDTREPEEQELLGEGDEVAVDNICGTHVSEEQELFKGDEVVEDNMGDIQLPEEQELLRDDIALQEPHHKVQEEQALVKDDEVDNMDDSPVPEEQELLRDEEIAVHEPHHKVQEEHELLRDDEVVVDNMGDSQGPEEQELLRDDEIAVQEPHQKVQEEQQLSRDENIAVQESHHSNVRKRCRADELDEEIRSLMFQQSPQEECGREAKKQKSDSEMSDDMLQTSISEEFVDETREERRDSREMESTLPSTSQETQSTGESSETGQENIETTATVAEQKTEQGRIDDALRELYRKTIGERKLI